MRLPEPTWQHWAWSLAEANADRRGGFPVRMPLFDRVLFPALLAGLDVALPGCARWLAAQSQLLYQCPRCLAALGEGRSSEAALLRLALAHDPTDRLARRRLIKALAEQFAYSLHELPSGVLFGFNGATPEQCGELRAELAEFETLVAADGVVSEYDVLTEDCRPHFSAYEQYLRQRPHVANYAAYLVGGEFLRHR